MNYVCIQLYFDHTVSKVAKTDLFDILNLNLCYNADILLMLLNLAGFSMLEGVNNKLSTEQNT